MNGNGLTPELPTLPVLSGDPEEDDKKILEGKKSVRSWMLKALGDLERARGNFFRAKTRSVRDKILADILKIAQGMKKILNDPNPDYLASAKISIIIFKLGRDEIKTQQEAEKLIKKLVTPRLLVPDPNGDLVVFNKARYKIFPAPPPTDEEKIIVKEVFDGVMKRVYEEIRRMRGDKSKDLKGRVTISWENLIAGKTGFCALDVPAEEVPANGNRQGFWRGGGLLLVRSDGIRIFPVDASGSIEKAVARAKSLDVFVKIKALRWDYPPNKQTLKEMGLSEEQAGSVQILFFLIKRAIALEEEKRRIQGLIQELSDGVTLIDPTEFFLEGKSGNVLVRPPEPWRWEVQGEEKIIPHLFLIVERMGEGESRKIRIVKVPTNILPDEFKDFFNLCMDEGYPEGEKFAGCPEPLGAILRATFKQVSEAAQDEGKIDFFISKIPV